MPYYTTIGYGIAPVYFAFFFAPFFPHRAAAAFFETSARRSGSIIENPFGTFFLPPARPSSTAALLFFIAIRNKNTTSAYFISKGSKIPCVL